jgi:outer membrane protein OmpA-like peptidoglycan-associated protein
MKKFWISGVGLALYSQLSIASDFTDRFWYGLSGSGGYQTVSSNLTTNTSKSGFLGNFRLFGEYQSDNWGALNLGIGGQETWQTGSTTARQQQLTVSAVLIDLSYLYPLWHLTSDSTFWVGVSLSTQTAAGAIFDFTNLQSTQVFTQVGPHVRYNFQIESWHVFAGLEGLYGLNSPNKTILTFPVYVGVMFRLGNEPKEDEVKPELKPESVQLPSPTVTVVPPLEKPKVELKLDAKLVTFDVNKTTLKPASVNFLAKVSKILVDQNDNWKAIEISGHTDGTGKSEHNLELSEGRARTVLDEFVKNGVSKERLSSKGYGSQKMIPGEPINSEVHRRVELAFDGVIDAEKLQKALDALKTQSQAGGDE